jgi:TRAP-type uncharacterized transport system substrate-binding protein
MIARRTLFKILWVWAAPLVGLSALAVAFAVYWHAPGERSYRLRITAGEALGTRHELAQVLRRQAAAHGLTLEIETTAGSEEALDLVNGHALDLALVQGGLRVDDRPHVRQVATLHIEPLHLLVRKELAPAVSANLTALAGKTVNLGTAGTGGHTLAAEILAFAGLHAQAPERPGGYAVSTWDREKLAAEVDPARLPDAVFLVASLPSEVAKLLVSRHDYRLVPLPFGEAFALDALMGQEPGQQQQPPSERMEKGRVAATVIPAFVYRVQPPVPPAALPTLGTRLLLVAHEKVDPHAVRRLLDTVYATEFASTSRPPLDTKLLDLPPEFPWHAGTRVYLDRNTPIVSGVVMDATHKGFAIFAAAASGLFVLWQWLKLRGRSLRDWGFGSYLSAVTRLEEQVRQIERDELDGLQRLLRLRDELGRLKTEALDRFTEGHLAGPELLQGFLLQVNDVRDHVARLIDRCSETPQGHTSGAELPQ